ncbi:hypothetical protein ACP70R_003254 [Stipagrostis hirtigluma subsp. patula]
MASPATTTTTRRMFAIFNSLGYSNLHGAARRSAVFSAAGYEWCIHYKLFAAGDVEHVGFFLQLVTRGARATASFDFSLLDITACQPPWPLVTMPPVEFDGDDPNKNLHGHTMPMSVLTEAPGSGYIDMADSFAIECTVTVIPETPTASSATAPQVKVPPSDMMEQLGKMYATKDGADVTYCVMGELFHAHKAILAMRSPVFKAELYGGMMESIAELIEVQDMRPDVFEALLQYIYTDALPATELGRQEGDDGRSEMMRHLLVGADRYGVERLKLLCEQALCDIIHAKNVAQMLAFANDHQCDTLKDACIWFMATIGMMDEVVVSEGYAQLRSTRPMILVQVLEKLSKFQK